MDRFVSFCSSAQREQRDRMKGRKCLRARGGGGWRVRAREGEGGRGVGEGGVADSESERSRKYACVRVCMSKWAVAIKFASRGAHCVRW